MPAHKMKSDEALMRAVLDGVLAHAEHRPFGDKLLDDAAREAGLSSSEAARLFPQGMASLLEFYSREADREMVRRLAELDLAAMKVRKRISTAVMTRLSVLKPRKNAACRAAAHLGLPHNLPLAVRLVYGTVDAMWRAAGDLSTDFNFYTKRAILAGVYTATLMRWFNDASADEHETEAFLAARIDEVMQYEKFKSQLRREADKGLDTLGDILRAARR